MPPNTMSLPKPPPLVMVTLLVSVTSLAKAIPPVAVMLPPKLAEPFSDRSPPTNKFAPKPVVKIPVLVTSNPPTVLSPTPFTVTFPALVIVSTPNGVPPINPVNKIFPMPAVRVRSRGVSIESLSSVLPKVMSPLLETIVTGALESVTAPFTVRPSKPVQFMPANSTDPFKVLPVPLLVRSTLPLNLVEPLSRLESMPPNPLTVLWKSTRPCDASVMAKPAPVPILVSAPWKVVVPSAVPEEMTRF